MKSYYKIAAVFLLSISITLFVSPIIAGIIPAHLYRIMSRMVLISSFFLFWYYREQFGLNSVRSLGFEFDKRWWALAAMGLALGVLSIVIISAIMINTSIRFIVPGVMDINWPGNIAKYIFAGFIVALIEECLFRGFILQSLLKDSGVFIALLATNIFYSVVHFLKPAQMPDVGTLHLFTSTNALPLFFCPLFMELPHIWPSLFGLFLVGIALSKAYTRTKNLALSVGLHAGWIAGIKLLSVGTDVTKSGSLWAGGNIVAHPLGWIMLIIFIAALSVKPREATKEA